MISLIKAALRAFLSDLSGAVAKKTATWAVICVACVGSFEGLRTKAYLDPVGIPTYCYGETRGARLGDQYTAEQCKDLLADRLEEFNAGVNRCVHVPLPDRRRAAVVSLAYNIGTGAFCKSSIVVKLNAGDVQSACDGFMAWNKATKAGVRIVLPGLTRRRAEERKMCLEGA